MTWPPHVGAAKAWAFNPLENRILTSFLGSHFHFISHSIFKQMVSGLQWNEERKKKYMKCCTLSFGCIFRVPWGFFFSSTFTRFSVFFFLFECNFSRSFDSKEINTKRTQIMTEKRLFCWSAMHFNVRTVNYEFEPYSQSIECIELYTTENANLSVVYFFYYLCRMFIISWVCLYLDWETPSQCLYYSSYRNRVVWKPCCNAFTLHFEIIAIYLFASTSALTDRLKMQTVEMVQWHEFMPLKRICPSN